MGPMVKVCHSDVKMENKKLFLYIILSQGIIMIAM